MPSEEIVKKTEQGSRNVTCQHFIIFTHFNICWDDILADNRDVDSHTVDSTIQQRHYFFQLGQKIFGQPEATAVELQQRLQDAPVEAAGGS